MTRLAQQQNQSPTLEEMGVRVGLKPEDIRHIATIDNASLYDAEQFKDVLSGQLGWQVVNKTASEKKSGLKTIDPRVTHMCDHACSHCWANLKGGHMSLETFESMLNLAKEAGIESIQFTGGEPTLNKHLIEMAEMAKEQGFNIVLRTHGRHMPKDSPVEGKSWAQAVAGVFDEVIVSIDGTAEANFAMRPVAIKEKGLTKLTVQSERDAAMAEVAATQFDETMAGYQALSEAVGDRTDIALKINSVVAKDNVDDIPRFGKFLSQQIREGAIRVDEWDMTQVVPAANDTPEAQAGYAISDAQFWQSVTSTALVSDNIPKRAKPVTSPRCLIVEKSGRVYVGGDEDIELGTLNGESVDTKAIADAIRNYDGKEGISQQRESGYLKYAPPPRGDRSFVSALSESAGEDKGRGR